MKRRGILHGKDEIACDNVRGHHRHRDELAAFRRDAWYHQIIGGWLRNLAKKGGCGRKLSSGRCFARKPNGAYCFHSLHNIGQASELIWFYVNQPQAPSLAIAQHFVRANVWPYERPSGRLACEQVGLFLLIENQMASVARHAAEAHCRYWADWGRAILEKNIGRINKVCVDV